MKSAALEAHAARFSARFRAALAGKGASAAAILNRGATAAAAHARNPSFSNSRLVRFT
jgi:hypothetical protein